MTDITDDDVDRHLLPILVEFSALSLAAGRTPQQVADDLCRCCAKVMATVIAATEVAEILKRANGE